ncbi:methyl-accepting chemotaxis protein [Paenibacillus sp. MBLB4367]|uniref:methyl-accepting chemotaxis protein n=1 Tax=Paenibacillus sp. MBLB4367 TaxID=3384767 RepID=UPI0039083E71
MGKRNVSMKIKLIASFAGMLAVFLAVAYFNLTQVRDIKSQHGVQNEKVSYELMALELKVLVQDLKDISSGLMISRKLEFVDKYNVKRKEYNELLQKIGSTAATPDQIQLRSQLIVATSEYMEVFDRAVRVIQDTSYSETDILKNTESLYNQAQQQRDLIFNLVDKFYRIYMDDANAATQASNEKMDDTVSVMIGAAAMILLVGSGIAFLLIRSFVRPIGRLQRAVALISEGDLRHKINAESNDELGQLSHSFDKMIDQVRHMLGSTQQIASSLSGHSQSFRHMSVTTASANADILKAIEEISAGADQQAQRTEQSAHIIGELDQEVRAVWEAARHMQQMSAEAELKTELGEASVQELSRTSRQTEAIIDQAVDAMHTLSAGSKQIGSIVKAITEISTQTHILALNAAIEAARAGVHGRGFSVVAEEVRTLAAQTNESSKSIGELIVTLQKQIAELETRMQETRSGLSKQNAKVGATLTSFSAIRSSMQDIGGQIDRIGGMIGNAQEQNKRLMDSVHFVAAVAEETAASVEEVNSTSYQQDAAIRLIAGQADDMNRLSQLLFEEINKFRIEPQQPNGNAPASDQYDPEASSTESGLPTEGKTKLEDGAPAPAPVQPANSRSETGGGMTEERSEQPENRDAAAKETPPESSATSDSERESERKKAENEKKLVTV